MKASFDQFTIDSDTRQLIGADGAIHLSPKAFDLLVALMEARPKVLEKAALHARIWPATHVVDANLNILIGEIRRALGDSGERQAFIRTVHGVGFAFCGTVARQTAAADEALFCWVSWKGKTFPLADGDNVIGRDPRCAVWVDADGVSRRHARIRVDRVARRVTLEDLGSTNGTFRRRVAVRGETSLSDGDQVDLGTAQLTVRLWASDRAPETRRIRRRTR